MLGDGWGTEVAGGVQPGGGAEGAGVAFAGVFDDVDQERAVAAVAAHQVEAGEAAGDEGVQDGQPEILEGAAAGVEGAGEGGAVGADAVGEGGQAGGLLRHGVGGALADGVDDQAVGGQGQVVAVLLGVADGDEDHFVAVVVGGDGPGRVVLAGVGEGNPAGA